MTRTPSSELFSSHFPRAFLDLDQLISLFAAATFLASFVLVAVHVMNIAFARTQTGTFAPVSGAPITRYSHIGRVPDELRDQILFVVSAFSRLLLLYVLIAASSFGGMLLVALVEGLFSQRITEIAGWFVLPVLAAKISFCFLWLFLIIGMARLLQVRVRLAFLI